MIFVGSSMRYDLTDGFDGDYSSRQSIKKRRSGDSPLSGIATRFGTRFPSFSRRWQGRKISPGAMTVDQGRHRSASLVTASRSSSMTRSTIDAHEYATPYDTTYPSSVVSLMEGVERVEDLDPVSAPSSIDIERANQREEPERGDRAQATTPLLPPLLIPESSGTPQQSSPIQSPLQSPTVAGSCETFSIVNSPLIDRAGPANPIAVHAPQLVSGMPTPPLSSKPSATSLRRPSNVTAHLVPSDEIPQMKLADPADIWSQKLGHANFDIHPEPYRPATFSPLSREQFHANWGLARCNFTKHLVRTGEHFGTTSKTYLLTEEKWGEIDARWRAHNEAMLDEIAAAGGEKEVLEERNAAAGTMVEIPELDVRGAEGKFPKLGDEVIVGPMVQIASQLQRKRSASRKARVLKWVREVKTSGVGGLGIRLGRGRSRTQ
jgi:hypothetical protein